MTATFGSWIDEENLRPTLQAIGWICDYQFSEEDWSVVRSGVESVSEEKNRWFDYTLTGRFPIKVGITMMSGSSNFTLRISCPEDIDGELKVITGLAQSYRFSDF